MARTRPGQRRIDQARLEPLLPEGRLRTIAKQLAADNGKTVEGARRQLQRWRDGTQTYISQENAVKLSAVLGVDPDDWSVDVAIDLLEQAFARHVKLAAIQREKAEEIRRQLRALGVQPPPLDE